MVQHSAQRLRRDSAGNDLLVWERRRLRLLLRFRQVLGEHRGDAGPQAPVGPVVLLGHVDDCDAPGLAAQPPGLPLYLQGQLLRVPHAAGVSVLSFVYRY